MKNNKIYESITFEVEKGLKKPDRGYYTDEIDNIFSSLFKRARNNIAQNGIRINDYRQLNERMEILHYEFDTEKTEFYNAKKKSLIQGLVNAYKNHYPITVSPDMIWILFLQGYSRFMEKHSELVRKQYVNFENKKKLSVERFGIFPENANKEIWQGIINEFIEKIKQNIGENIMSNLQSNFSTTNPVSLATSQVSIMSAMKQYFTYSVGMGGCGISSITLEGSLNDWEGIKSKLEFLSKKRICIILVD